MLLHRFIIGVKFNEKMFRLSSVAGVAIDEVLSLRKTESSIGESYFTGVSIPLNSVHDYSVSLVDERKENEFVILQDQVIFKKSTTSKNISVDIDQAIEEFKILWRTANKTLSFGHIRRVGFVGEFRIDAQKPDAAGVQLIDCLTKFDKPECSTHFKLTYESRNLNSNGVIPSNETADFWNTLFTFYNSEIDESPEKGKIYASIDIQRFFNPAKTDLIKELPVIKKKFLENKSVFKEKIKNMGLSDK